MSKYQPVIGLEIHIELATESKMFCGCRADHFGKKPNTQTCPVCLGLPGALPVPNKKALDWTIMIGLALSCKINRESRFDRKHYFYPDLPKGFQISQYAMPLCHEGIFGKKIRIRRVHLEEDTGKLVHKVLGDRKVSLVDFNRSGVPLVEVVTEPDFDSATSVEEFAKELQRIVRYLGVSDCDMEKGSMRLEANISLRKPHQPLPGYKVELKNINSFRFMRRAIEAEIKRQENILRGGGTVKQETRGYDEAKAITFSQRTKEEEEDYRYFPEPDIPPMRFSKNDISRLRLQIPKLPQDYRVKFKQLGLPANYIEVLVNDKSRVEYFLKACLLAEDKLEDSARTVAKMMVNQNLDKKFKQPDRMVEEIIQSTKAVYSTSDDVRDAVDEVISQNPEVVAKYKAGKIQVLGFLVGSVQKLLGGKADPRKVREMLLSALQ